MPIIYRIISSNDSALRQIWEEGWILSCISEGKMYFWKEEKKKRVYEKSSITWVKHLQINPSIKLWIERSRNALPKPIIEAINKLCTGCTQEGTLIPVPEPILWLIPEPLDVATQPNEYQESIKYLKNLETERIPEYAESYRDEWIKFCYYWSEKWKTWKIRAEWEKTFEIKRRFATWMSRKKETYQKTEKPSVMDITL